ncbi:hypothetical protein GmHk_08G023698 [Glycine max]|nr:hypothetical protein GmHk_08G023698 [Glycine max]
MVTHSRNSTFNFLAFWLNMYVDVRCRSGDLVCGEEDDERDPRSCAVTGECDGGSGRGCGRCGVEEKKKKIDHSNLQNPSYLTVKILLGCLTRFETDENDALKMRLIGCTASLLKTQEIAVAFEDNPHRINFQKESNIERQSHFMPTNDSGLATSS